MKEVSSKPQPESQPSVFCSGYADAYDLLYREKDYEAECDLIEEVFRRYANGKIEKILDLGCGTGNHAIPLACRGYEVTGVDLSSDMLTIARSKVANPPILQPSNPLFFQGDLRSLDLQQQFDAVLMMFAVLGYQITNDDVLAALQTVSRHLKPGGLFVCDVWYGPAVLAQRPGERVKVIPTPGGKIIRVAKGTLDTFNHLGEVHYHLWRIKGQEVISESEEKHAMRYFFPQELELFMSASQLRLINLSAFGSLDQMPSESTWTAIGVITN